MSTKNGMIAMSLGDILKGAIGVDEDTASSPRPLPEAVIMDLTSIAERYSAPNPFKVGDIVTPRRGYNIRGSGEPHVVLETETSVPRFSVDQSETSSSSFGRKLDMRVACLTPAGPRFFYQAFWGESWCYEFYEDAVRRGGPVGEDEN